MDNLTLQLLAPTPELRALPSHQLQTAPKMLLLLLVPRQSQLLLRQLLLLLRHDWVLLDEHEILYGCSTITMRRRYKTQDESILNNNVWANLLRIFKIRYLSVFN